MTFFRTSYISQFFQFPIQKKFEVCNRFGRPIICQNSEERRFFEKHFKGGLTLWSHCTSKLVNVLGNRDYGSIAVISLTLVKTNLREKNVRFGLGLWKISYGNYLLLIAKISKASASLLAP